MTADKSDLKDVSQVQFGIVCRSALSKAEPIAGAASSIVPHPLESGV